jgi:soluble lytic murein transglycosylase-like protein
VLKFTTPLTFAGLLICVSPAEAQIYSWRDSNGNLVLSNRKLSPDARAFPLLEASSVQTTMPVVAAGAHDGYADLIAQHAEANEIRPDLVKAVIQVESAFNPLARSPQGAIGLMQLMPSTAADLGVTDPYDPGQNIRGGCAYLRRLLDRYDNNEELALAAYNAGPLAVDRHGSAVPPYRETRDYVKRIKGITAVSGSASASTSVVSAGRVFYKTIEMINGRPVPRYSDSKPPSGEFEVVALGR